MEINTVPVNLAGALGDLIYTVNAEKTEIADLEVLASDGERVMTVRRLSGSEEYRINVSGYVNAQLKVEPDTDSPTGIVPRPGAAARCSVRIGEAVSPVSIHCAGEKRLDYLMPMSCAGYDRKLQWYGAGRDEVAFVADGGEVSWNVSVAEVDGTQTLVMSGSSETVVDNVYSMIVDCREAIGAAFLKGIGNERCIAVLLSVEASGAEFIRREYRLRGPIEDGICVAWLNEWGGIDRAWFRLLESRLKLDNPAAELPDGCRSMGGSSCEIMKLASPVVNAEEAERLWTIVRAPVIWVVSGTGHETVVIESRELLRVAGEMDQVVLDVRRPYRVRSQKL